MMKSIKLVFVLTTLFLVSFSISSCKNSSKDEVKTEQSDQKDQSGIEYTSAYICPMHCEGSGSDSEGTCPVCGMDYVKNEEYESHNHSHDNHEGHDH